MTDLTHKTLRALAPLLATGGLIDVHNTVAAHADAWATQHVTDMAYIEAADGTIAELRAEVTDDDRRLRNMQSGTINLESYLAEKEAEGAELREKYYDLLLNVATVHTGESRHETAKRYIVEAEKGRMGDGMATKAALPPAPETPA